MRLVFKYIGNLLLLQLLILDFALNTLLGGSPLETVSRRAGRVKIAAGGTFPRRRWFLRFVDWLTELVDDKHLIEAAKGEIGSMGVVDTPQKLRMKYGD